MALVSPVPSPADLERVPWRDAIATAERPECWAYSRVFFGRSKEASSAGDEMGAGVFSLLGHIASMMLRPEEPRDPLKAQIEWATNRSASPDDLSEAEVEILSTFYPAVEDPELQARLGDLLWILKNDHKAARVAVEAYFASADRLLGTAPWPYSLERIRRAVSLAALLGKSAECYAQAVSRAVDIFRGAHSSADQRFVAELLEVLLEHGAGNSEEMAAVAEERARQLEVSSQTELSRWYWRISSECKAKAHDESGRLAALEAIAESHLADARRAGAGANPRPFVALHHLTRAIEAFRRLPGARSRVEEIQKELPSLEIAAMRGMGRIATPFDPTETVRRAREAVAGKPLFDAIKTLAFSAGPVSTEDLRQEVLKSAQDLPLRARIPRVVVDAAGRTVGRRGPIEPSDPDEVAVRAEMLDHLRLYRHLHVVGVVEPMRREILRTHRLSNSDLFFLIESNPLIEPGHEQLFLRGLRAGFEGDFMVATHLLIPQIENSLRKLLFDSGAPVTTIDDHGVQQLIGLEQTLRHPSIVGMLGENGVFDLMGLLVERTSTAFRHRFAHGLLADSDFSTTEAVYVWWITLRLFMVPVASRTGGEHGGATRPAEGPAPGE